MPDKRRKLQGHARLLICSAGVGGNSLCVLDWGQEDFPDSALSSDRHTACHRCLRRHLLRRATQGLPSL